MRGLPGGSRVLGPGAAAALVAVVIFWIAYDNGSYGQESRSALAIVLWWGIVVAVAFGLIPRRPVGSWSLGLGAVLGVFALWTLVSLLWTSDAEGTLDEFNRAALYLGVFVVVTSAAGLGIDRWATGLGIGIGTIAAVALVSRLLPGSFPAGDLPTFLPGSVTRLSFPLGYWNGLAIFLALGLPLLLRLALVLGTPLLRGLAVAPLPIIGSAIYLTSSRGGVVTALIAVGVFLALTERRWAAAAALVASCAGTAVATIVLMDRKELVNGPLGTALVERQGRTAALLIGLTCVGTGAAFGIGDRLLAGRVRIGDRLSRGVVAFLGVICAIGVVLVNPLDWFESFKTPRTELTTVQRGDFVTHHLLSGSGNGRWQFWSAAVDEWWDRPFLGGGAGSFESWWAQHGSITHFTKDAHSLYIEALGELGPVGFILTLTLAVVGLAAGISFARSSVGDSRVTAAALTAVFAGYATAAALDWVWELTAVTVTGVAVLALIGSAATSSSGPALRVATPKDISSRAMRGFGAGALALLVGWVLIVVQAVPLIAQWEIGDSRAAVEQGDLEHALEAARGARDIEPWAATPYLQIALIHEELSELPAAATAIDRAIARSRRDWRLWLVAARIQTKLGDVREAERSLRRAASLNPRSPLFEGLPTDG